MQKLFIGCLDLFFFFVLFYNTNYKDYDMQNKLIWKLTQSRYEHYNESGEHRNAVPDSGWIYQIEI